MQLIRETIDGVVVVAPQGDYLDASNARLFLATLAPLVAGDVRVLLDLGRIKWVDSGGCGALLSCCKELRDRGGDLKLFGVGGSVRSLFQIIRLHRIFDIFNTREEGVAAFEELAAVH